MADEIDPLNDPDDEVCLVCLPVGDRPPADPQSERGHYCKECNAEIWLSLLARKFLEDNEEVTLVCARCSIGMVPDMKELQALPGDTEGEAVINLMPEIIDELYGDRE
jgi:hypothetical protein